MAGLAGAGAGATLPLVIGAASVCAALESVIAGLVGAGCVIVGFGCVGLGLAALALGRARSSSPAGFEPLADAPPVTRFCSSSIICCKLRLAILRLRFPFRL